MVWFRMEAKTDLDRIEDLYNENIRECKDYRARIMFLEEKNKAKKWRFTKR